MQSTSLNSNSNNTLKPSYRQRDKYKKQKKNSNINKCNIQQGKSNYPNIADVKTKEIFNKSGNLKKIDKKNNENSFNSNAAIAAAFVDNQYVNDCEDEEKHAVNILNRNENSSKSPSSSSNDPFILMKNSGLLALFDQVKDSIKHTKSQIEAKKVKEICGERNNNENFSDSDDDEYIEYVFKPRPYFFFSMCQLCKQDIHKLSLPCKECFMTYYCSMEHMHADKQHKELCLVLKVLANSQGGHIFNKTNCMSGDDFRNFRIQMINTCERILKRNLELFEKEIILYPRICCEGTCKQWEYSNLTICKKCQQVAFCKNNPSHLSDNHKLWCSSFSTMTKLIQLHYYGNVPPDMPNNGMLRNKFDCGMTMKESLYTLYERNEIESDVTFANVSQYATSPLTVWYGLRLCGLFRKQFLNVHVVGAEFHFEVNNLQKWEYFCLHLTPYLKELNLTFIGPELEIPGISFELLSKIRMCETCKSVKRKLNFKFENSLYHDYHKKSTYEKPDLICFFNPGLYRFTGFENVDTWAETIRVSAAMKCPVIVTSYTEYESPLDLKRFIQEAQRCMKIILPPTINPFSSSKPERNFISDDIVPLMFKNSHCFIVE